MEEQYASCIFTLTNEYQCLSIIYIWNIAHDTPNKQKNEKKRKSLSYFTSEILETFILAKVKLRMSAKGCSSEIKEKCKYLKCSVQYLITLIPGTNTKVRELNGILGAHK